MVALLAVAKPGYDRIMVGHWLCTSHQTSVAGARILTAAGDEGDPVSRAPLRSHFVFGVFAFDLFEFRG